MATIRPLETGHYRIPLPVALTDSTHGVMTAFEIVTAKVLDDDGFEGVGYTYTTGHNGGAIANILVNEFPDVVIGQDADLIEMLWQKAWWCVH